MKKTTKVLLIAAMLALIAAAVTITAAAESFDLEVGSDRVYFIRDIPEDFTGRGTGNSPDDPFVPTKDYEGFDPEAQNPKYHLTTSLYQAVEMIKDTGGTIVICGPLTIGEFQATGNNKSYLDCFTPKFKMPIKFTSVYNGVDYRETAGACLIIKDGAGLAIEGESIWENLDIVTGSQKSGRFICFDYYKTIVGEGVNCRNESPDFEGVAEYYVSLVAGHRYSRKEGGETHLIVRSGTYNMIVGSSWYGVSVTWGGDDAAQEKFDKWKTTDLTSHITVEGTTHVLGGICGSSYNMAAFGGYCNIEINGGTIEGDVYGGSAVTFINDDATVNIKITGGNFTDGLFSVVPQTAGAKGNPPAKATLDLSELPFSEENWISATNIFNVTTDFEESDVKFPDWWAEKGPYQPETEPPATEPETEPETEAESVADTEAIEETDAPEVKAPESDKKVTQEEKSEGGFPWLIVSIIAGVVIVCGVVAVILGKKKKGGKTSE